VVAIIAPDPDQLSRDERRQQCVGCNVDRRAGTPAGEDVAFDDAGRSLAIDDESRLAVDARPVETSHQRPVSSTRLDSTLTFCGVALSTARTA
jgi:hypothetical protein